MSTNMDAISKESAVEKAAQPSHIDQSAVLAPYSSAEYNKELQENSAALVKGGLLPAVELTGHSSESAQCVGAAAGHEAPTSPGKSVAHSGLDLTHETLTDRTPPGTGSRDSHRNFIAGQPGQSANSSLLEGAGIAALSMVAGAELGPGVGTVVAIAGSAFGAEVATNSHPFDRR